MIKFPLYKSTYGRSHVIETEDPAILQVLVTQLLKNSGRIIIEKVRDN